MPTEGRDSPLSYREIVISDLRMGFDERLVFSFVVERREGEAIEPAPVRRRPGPDFPPGTWSALGERILGRSAEPACLEIGHAKRAAVALESVPQGRKRTVLVHPLAQIAEDLLAGPVAVQPFQLGPLSRLSFAEEGKRLFRENRAIPVETLASAPHIAVVQQMAFSDRSHKFVSTRRMAVARHKSIDIRQTLTTLLG